MHLYHHELVRRGWTVLLVNPRGSDGYGEAFYDAVRGAWGEADARDFLEPVDALVAEGIADPDRLAVTGYSYGGYMTCYLTAHDDRFAAAVPGGVVSDLSSIGGSSDDAHLLNALELELYPWRDRDRLARLSPYSGVDRVTTPTLVLHGADDRTCPVGQAQQWHHALRERGVPTRMVLYPGASHVFILAGRPSHRLDYYRRVVEWVEQHAGDATGSRPARIDGGHWSRRLAALARRHQVPGAQLGILRLGSGGGDDEVVRAATGVLNAATGQQATEDSVWQIGSISKVWTATVVMMLVDEGKIALDTPVGEIIPELRLSAPGLTEQVTVWHLLTHTSGIDGDIFTDTGRGDDCLEKYVGELADAAQNHPIGATWSYCNSGFSLLGRVIEKVTGTTWDEAMRGAALHAAGAPAHGHPAGGGDAPRVRDRARHRPARAPGRAGLGGCRARPAPRASSTPTPPTCSRSPGSTCRAASRPTAPGCSRRRAPGGWPSGRWTARRSTCSATPGASAGSASTGTGTCSTATTATRSARRPSCACCPRPGSRSCSSPTGATPGTSTRTSTARSSRSSPTCGSRTRSCCRRSRWTSTSRPTSAPTSVRRSGWRCCSRTSGPCCGRR
ncbi:prolyl oligopeptidase family serine peptidase [Nocardioides sp. TF02-7]|uniref:prolyl oligopeptidase family serine peptidase n=1 Tax=Nocardioides sp. TF02-7 TaxID=2917724 RepID=UPI001F0648B5|nr:prolyl oligopeptidase family serine peptidase [Nocardioides sp. TF02-7]UMG94660.1 prolyl oligopeptidase family serine peptidase [Nocardioides sp. TF02-7]